MESNNVKEKYLVSIVVPVYNVRDYIEECLDSIINQTYKNIEILLVNDGSTDGSGEVCDEYAKKDERIKVFHQENQGVVAARCKAIEEATGEYMCFVDSDDIAKENMVQFFVENIGDCDLITGGIMYQSSLYASNELYDGIKEGVYKTKEEMEYVINNLIINNNGIVFGIIVGLCSKMYKTNIIKSCISSLDKELVFGEDRQFLYCYLFKCTSVRITKKVAYVYKYRVNSAGHYVDNNYLSNINKLYLALCKICRGHSLEKNIVNQIELQISSCVSAFNNRMGFSVDAAPVKYVFPFLNLLDNKKVILYGAGDVGTSYYRQIIQCEDINMVAWVDKNWEKLKTSSVDIRDISCISELEYDGIIVAVKRDTLYANIKEELIKIGVPEEKIWWKKPIYIGF